MAFNVDIALAHTLQVAAPFDEVFEVLADIPQSASHFPQVKQLTDLGDHTYRWEMEKAGSGQASLQIAYASRYRVDRADGTVVWTPVAGEGNALVGGSWKARRSSDGGTALEFRVDASVLVPLPGLMKMVAAPMVKSELAKLVEQYLDNLARRFGGPGR